MKKRTLWVLAWLLTTLYVYAQESTPENALAHYIAATDNCYQWQLQDSLREEGRTSYRLLRSIGTAFFVKKILHREQIL